MKKFSISAILIFYTLFLIAIMFFNAITIPKYIQTNITDNVTVVNKLGQIRGSIQRISKLKLVNKKYSEIDRFIKNLFMEMDKRYFCKDSLYSEEQIKRYKSLKLEFYKLEKLNKKDDIINSSEKCWYLANIIAEDTENISKVKSDNLFHIIKFRIIFVVVLLIFLLLFTYITINKGLETNMVKDPLTSLYNRYHLIEKLEKACYESKSKNNSVSIIFLDIDHFKQINDKYGHQVGDSVLIEISKILKDKVRGDDSVFRYGGEEVIILLPNISKKGAYEIAERLRKFIENHHFNIDKQITISAGVAEYKNGESVKSFIKRADEAVYKAKGSGRNIVIIADEESKTLVDILLNDHKELLSIYNEINESAKNREFTKLLESIDKFVIAYEAHILLEDSKLYIQLKDKYKNEKHILDLIIKKEKEMNYITEVLLSFVNKYQNVDDKNVNKFLLEFEEIGSILVERITFEEERLYSLC